MGAEPISTPRQLTLADAMILVGMTGFGLSCYLLADNALFNGQRYLYGLFRPPGGGWSATAVTGRAAGAVGLILPLFGSWTFALPLLRWRRPRPGWRKLWRQPGVTACVAATVGMAAAAGAMGLACLLKWWIDGVTGFPPAFCVRIPALENVVVFAGVSVVAAWAMPLVTGHWRRPVDWVDRLGRWLGGLWVVAALVFYLRFLLS